MIQGMPPLMPDAGMAMQLVHHDDVATAMAAGERGSLQPGCGRRGLVALGRQGDRQAGDPRAVRASCRRVGCGGQAADVAAAAERIHVARGSIVVDTSRAKDVLGWHPQYTSCETLAALAEIL